MKSGPQPSLIVIPPQEGFAPFMKLLDVPATMGILDHRLQGGGCRKVGEVVFPLPRLTPCRPLANKPTQLLTLSFQRSIDADGHEFLAQPSFGAFSPGNRLPFRQGHLLQHRIGATTSLIRLTFHLDMKITRYRDDIVLLPLLQARQKSAISSIVGIGAYYLTGLWRKSPI